MLRFSSYGGGAFFHNLKTFFAPFFLVEAFLIRLSPYGGPFLPMKSLSATYFSMWGLFATFSPYGGGIFSLFEGPFATISPFGGPFSPFKDLSATFFSMWRPFCYVFLMGEAFFHLLKAFLLLFFSMWGCCFCFYGDPFWLAPALPKFRRGLMPACPLTPMSKMQYNHSLTASCHFRDILKIVTKYFLIYIFAWLTIFKIRKRNENNIF